MDVDSRIKLPNFARPVSFSGLMALYESNYARLYSLLPRRSMIRTAGMQLVSRTSEDCELYLCVREVTTFTTTLNMTYLFSEGASQVADPDLTVRVYHDAGLAEAMACCRHHIHEALLSFETEAGQELNRRWTRNMMFNKWLEYCMDRRHRFHEASENRSSIRGCGVMV
ncbi:MAG: DUF1249 domain-containing protein [Pseudomonadota bacterium]